MLEIRKLKKSYGDLTILDHIDLTLENGIYGLLAPNGAGKTTLLKILATLSMPDEGRVLWNGEDIFKLDFRYRSILGFLPQDFGYYRDYSPQRYLEYLAVLKGMKKDRIKERVTEWLNVVGLEDVRNKKMKKLSGGMIQRVGIAQALMNDPEILILDEPTAGLDPKERVRFRNVLSELSKDKVVLLSTHIVSDVENAASRVILLKDGKIFCSDTIAETTKMLEGKIYEAVVDENGYDKLKETCQILTVRQTGEGTCAKFVCVDGTPYAGDRCAASLEDVFLYLYR